MGHFRTNKRVSFELIRKKNENSPYLGKRSRVLSSTGPRDRWELLSIGALLVDEQRPFFYAMQYSSTIDNVTATRWGLNLSQAYLFDYIFKLPSWADPVIYEGEYFHHCSRNKIIKDLPLLKFKTDTAYRNLKQLEEAGVIVFLKFGRKDLLRLTEKGREWGRVKEEEGEKLGSKSEFQQELPLKLGYKSELNSDINPTNYNNIITRKKPFTQWTLEDLVEDIKANMDKFPELDGHDLEEFESYWSEETPKGKMLFQTQKSWSTSGRLKRWAIKKLQFNTKNGNK